MGSLHITDFKDAHFWLKDGKIKLTNLDDVSSLEASCIVNDMHQHIRKERRCNYGLKCIGGICPGHNAKANMDNMYKLFFSNLLVVTGPESDATVNHILLGINDKLRTLSVNAAHVKELLTPLLNVPYEMV